MPSLFFEPPLLLPNIPGLFVATLVDFCQISCYSTNLTQTQTMGVGLLPTVLVES
ncbi:MAG: hypothetical protein F6K11_06475 [Leptolyngbya sp. SIO3F4]|nr:hypothetical protein [Leptolyngbya sp. SIO3F4]